MKKKSKSGKATKKSIPPISKISFEDHLSEQLKDLEFAAGYLTAALDEGEESFLLAIRDVAHAQGGLREIAKATKLNRENLYSMLSKKGNPRLSSLNSVLNNLGIQLKFAPKLQGSEAA